MLPNPGCIPLLRERNAQLVCLSECYETVGWSVSRYTSPLPWGIRPPETLHTRTRTYYMHTREDRELEAQFISSRETGLRLRFRT
jgi:hypothetical protein